MSPSDPKGSLDDKIPRGIKKIQEEQMKNKVGFPRGNKNPKLSEQRVGNLNPFYGKKHSEKTKQKIREFQRGTKQSEKHIQNRTESRIEFYDKKGRKSSFNELLRHQSKWKIWRELVFLRDNFMCQNPNCEFCKNRIGVLIHPHHIKPVSLYPELAFKPENGITYCAEFHLKSGLHKNMELEVAN